MMTNIQRVKQGNTLTGKAVFAFLHTLDSRTLDEVTEDATTTYAIKNANCKPLVNALGITVAEVWEVNGGFDVWYDMKDDCNILNPRFRHRKAFRGSDASTKLDEFIFTLM